MKRKEERAQKKKLKKNTKAEEEEKEAKQALAEKAYKAWLRNSRKLGTPHSQAINGSLLQYLHKDKQTAVFPSYINPIPWVSVAPDERTTTTTQKVEKFSSPPMLWKEIERRDNQTQAESRKPKRRDVHNKHSCSRVVAY